MYPILTPLEALKRSDEDVYVKFCWKSFPIAGKVRQLVEGGQCGDLCSLRFTAARPKRQAVSEEVFLFDRFCGMLEGAEFIAGSPLKTLSISKASGANTLFAISQCDNGVTCEYECNECLPDSMKDIAFVKANFTGGHVTNQPLVGYFNDEGMLVADDDDCSLYTVEQGGRMVSENPFQWMKSSFVCAVEQGKVIPGTASARRLVALIKGALK